VGTSSRLVFVAASGRQVYLKDAAGTYYVFDMPFE